jgi:1-acyl-sn-glycerol-3-phosphate acyltransferase
MYALMRLSGQEYVDVYAATQKARIASGHAAPAEGAETAVAAPGGRPAPEVHVPVPPEDDATPSVG